MRDYENTAKALRCCRLTSARGCAECPYSVNNNEKCAHLLNDAADAIEELLAAVPKWISVEERLPEGKGDYWCNVRSYNFDDTYYQHEVWFDGESFVIDGVCTDRVTHWMPLPEPPKEVE